MPSFRRPFRLIERLFPSSGLTNRDFPDNVDNTVQPIWDAFALRPGDVTWISRIFGGTSAGAGTFATTGPEPPAGTIWIPIAITVGSTDVAGKNVVLRVEDIGATSPTRDPWGSWFDDLFGIGILIPVGHTTVAGTDATIAKPLSLGPPIMRTTRWNLAHFGTTGAGIVVTWNVLALQVPGEVVRMENWRDVR